MFFQKIVFIVLLCRTFGNFEWTLLLQFPKDYKTLRTNHYLYLIPIAPKISPLLSEYTLNKNSH